MNALMIIVATLIVLAVGLPFVIGYDRAKKEMKEDLEKRGDKSER